MPDFSIEREYTRGNFEWVAGVDEAGRGCLFGPVVASAVIFPPSWIEGAPPPWLSQVDDSKALRPAKRQALCRLILQGALEVGLGWATSREVDSLNIHRASLTAMRRAVAALPHPPDVVLVDGFELKGVHYLQQRVKQGDRRSLTIAAASIVAKVLRDGMMNSLDRLFEGLGLTRHKGYGTREHFLALDRQGRTPLHRLSFNLKSGAWKR
ncbi:MAG: ribonuclease HII [Candidatus Aminicenantes bacterium RBG_13_62_12]|nr:MAG: ribonuclease HII [Candidatus Aminicenantes bacterium RBG_13_62_12]